MSRVFIREDRDNNWYYESPTQPKKSMKKFGVPAGDGGRLAAQMLQNKWDKEAFYSANGLVNPDKRWDEFRDEHLELYAPPAHAESSFAKLKVVVREFEAAVMAPSRLLMTLTDEDIVRWRKARLGAGLSARSLDAEERCLRPMIQRAQRKGYIKVDPFADVPKIRFAIPEPKHLSVPEANNFLDILAREYPEHILLGLLAYESGMRVGELVHLRLEDIDFMKGVARLLPHEGFCDCYQCSLQASPGWIGKAGIPRPIPLSPRANAMLLSLYQGRKNGNVFPMRENAVKRIFKRIFALAGIKGKACTHIFRHTFATHCDQAGLRRAITSRILGHSSRTVTDGYTHSDGEEELRRQHQLLLDWRSGHQAAQIAAIQ